MTDIAFKQDTSSGFDFDLAGQVLLEDDGIKSAVIVSLFTDRHANDEDQALSVDRRGYWGDSYADIDGDLIGSRRWLLARAKKTQDTLNKIIEYDTEALQWMLDDGVAKSINVTAEWHDNDTLVEIVQITKPDDTDASFRFQSSWESINAV